jgi:hypothetical protein
MTSAGVMRLAALACRFPSPTFVGCLAFHPHILAAFGTNTYPAPMRYIRFLKTPRAVVEKNTARSEVHCLITITSDLGDSFLPYNIQLSGELLACTETTEDVLVWRTVQWTGGMRSLPITIPMPKSQPASSQLRVRVGVEPRRAHDEYASLSGQDARGVVSAWSAAFTPRTEASKLIERRFILPTGTVNIWEETGESIARHLWYGSQISGITMLLFADGGIGTPESHCHVM